MRVSRSVVRWSFGLRAIYNINYLIEYSKTPKQKTVASRRKTMPAGRARWYNPGFFRLDGDLVYNPMLLCKCPVWGGWPHQQRCALKARSPV